LVEGQEFPGANPGGSIGYNRFIDPDVDEFDDLAEIKGA